MTIIGIINSVENKLKKQIEEIDKKKCKMLRK